MEERLKSLWAELRELTLHGYEDGGVERLHSAPSPLRFLRDFVSANRPCIISRGAAVAQWPALTRWSHDSYLISALRSTHVSVHLTPNGHADAIVPYPSDNGSSRSETSTSTGTRMCFASACVQRVPFPEALRLIESPPAGVAAYAQQQDDCLRGEYAAVAGDIEDHIPWATEALGCAPEAVNLWIGNGRSETWFHKDHYENLYAVITGQKHFLLLPPTDVHRLYVRNYPAARWELSSSSSSSSHFPDSQYSHSDSGLRMELRLEEPRREVPWCSVDPFPPTMEALRKQRSEFPLYFDGGAPKPFHCTVNAGDILYLPSMWFHHVRQTPDPISGTTIAVNYWYDMQFDVKYAYFNFLQSIPLPAPAESVPHGQIKHELLDEDEDEDDDYEKA